MKRRQADEASLAVKARMDDGFASLAGGHSQEGRWQEGTAGQRKSADE
jgi:hypothetical protein